MIVQNLLIDCTKFIVHFILSTFCTQKCTYISNDFMYKTPDIEQKDVQCTENNEFSLTNCTMYKFFKTVQLRYDCTDFFVQLYKIKCTRKLDFPCGADLQREIKGIVEHVVIFQMVPRRIVLVLSDQSTDFDNVGCFSMSHTCGKSNARVSDSARSRSFAHHTNLLFFTKKGMKKVFWEVLL